MALGDPSPSVARWLLASPGTAAMDSWDALLCSGPEREGRDTARAPGEPPKVTGGPGGLSSQDPVVILG